MLIRLLDAWGQEGQKLTKIKVGRFLRLLEGVPICTVQEKAKFWKYV